MKYNSIKEVTHLRVKLCNNIENEFPQGGTIEFNQPFTIYVTEENTYDDSVVKAPYLVRQLIDGKYLVGRTSNGDEFDDLSIYSLEDIVEVAYILDTIGDKQYKILEDEQSNS
jgi:hypothetical protein